MGLDTALMYSFPEIDDKKFADLQRRSWEALQSGLRAIGLHGYEPPQGADPGVLEFHSCQIGSYGALHDLRRYAVYALNGKTPPRENDDDTDDPLLRQYYTLLATRLSGDVHISDPKTMLAALQAAPPPRPADPKPRKGGLLSLFRKSPPTPPPAPARSTCSLTVADITPSLHLVHHSDCEGWYVPMDFPYPLEVPHKAPDGKNMQESIGSTVRLLAELDAVAAHLRLPDDIDPEGDDFDTPVDNGEPWQQHPTSARVCAALRHMARASIKHHALLVFC